MAYHAGNAANIAPPAVISHTSLPSQTGPMVLSDARGGSVSPLPTGRTVQQHADAEVEALEDEVPDQQHRDQDEPDDAQGSMSISLLGR